MDTQIMGLYGRKLPVPRRFYNPSDIFSKLGLSGGRNLKGKRFSLGVGEWAILRINTDVYRVSVISYLSELNNVNNERTRLTLIIYFGVNLEIELHTRINK